MSYRPLKPPAFLESQMFQRDVKSLRSKYNVGAKSKRIYRGWTFDSVAEKEYAERLDFQQEQGEVIWWLRQVPVDLTDDDRYRLDFLVMLSSGIVNGVEVKGYETPEWKRNKRLWEKFGPFPLQIVKRKKTVEVINPLSWLENVQKAIEVESLNSVNELKKPGSTD